MKKNTRQLKKQAESMGACSSIINNWDKMGMVEKYYEGAKWCMEREYPSYSVLDKFDKQMAAYGIYNRKDVNIVADREQYIFNGSKVKLEVSGYSVCRIFIGRGTELDITVKDNGIAIVSNYGGTVNRNTFDKGRCLIWDEKLVV